MFGTRGQGARCQCQRYKLRPRESFGSFPVEERACRLRQQTDCGHPESDTTSGLVAYLDGEPVSWCAVEPRTAYEGLVAQRTRPRQRLGADVLVHPRGLPQARRQPRTRERRGGLRERGARAIEGYPIATKNVIAEELHVGTEGVLAHAGFTEVSRPTLRRLVMRVEF